MPPTLRAVSARVATGADVAALSAFRAYYGGGSWFERAALKVLRRARAGLDTGSLSAEQQVLLFESEDELVAVAVLDKWEPDVGLVCLVAVHRDYRGATTPGAKLSATVLATSLEELAAAGHTRAVAEVASAHDKSKALLASLGFRFESMLDSSYELHAVSL